MWIINPCSDSLICFFSFSLSVFQNAEMQSWSVQLGCLGWVTPWVHKLNKGKPCKNGHNESQAKWIKQSLQETRGRGCMRESLMWSRWWTCFYSNKEALRGESQWRKDDSKSHYKPLACVEMFNGLLCSVCVCVGVCPVVTAIAAITCSCYVCGIIWSNITALE